MVKIKSKDLEGYTAHTELHFREYKGQIYIVIVQKILIPLNKIEEYKEANFKFAGEFRGKTIAYKYIGIKLDTFDQISFYVNSLKTNIIKKCVNIDCITKQK